MAEVKRQPATKNEQHLDLSGVVSILLADGLLRPDDPPTIRASKPQKDEAENHPLAIIAKRGLSSARPPHKALTLEALTVWLAERTRLPYLRIDPLKVDVTAVTS